MSSKTSPRRTEPRAAVTLDLLLLRDKGGRVAARTLDVGAGGMCVTTDRPLGVDEVLHFDLSLRDRHVDGQARVLRMHGPNVYALRIEELDETDRRLLTDVAQETA